MRICRQCMWRKRGGFVGRLLDSCVWSYVWLATSLLIECGDSSTNKRVSRRDSISIPCYEAMCTHLPPPPAATLPGAPCCCPAAAGNRGSCCPPLLLLPPPPLVLLLLLPLVFLPLPLLLLLLLPGGLEPLAALLRLLVPRSSSSPPASAPRPPPPPRLRMPPRANSAPSLSRPKVDHQNARCGSSGHLSGRCDGLVVSRMCRAPRTR